jgi:glycylpeptide N-tetradecanoyltransferase
LCGPNENKDWHIGVKASSSGKLLAFVSGTPLKVVVNEKPIKMALINFMCVH